MFNSVRCPNCKSPEAINFFNWKLAQNPNNENHPFTGSFTPTGKLKDGIIYQSTCCSSKWYLVDGIFMYLINPLRQEILNEWSNRNLQVPAHMRSILSSIGPNSKHGTSVKEYPCKAEFKDHSTNEFCIIRLGSLPPDFSEAISGKRSKTYSYIDDAVSIDVSCFALPPKVRKETMNPTEIGMGGYAPTIFSDVHGKVYKVNAFESFTSVKIDEPTSVLGFNSIQGVNAIGLYTVPVKVIIADSL